MRIDDLQKLVNETFLHNFGKTPLKERLDDVLKETLYSYTVVDLILKMNKENEELVKKYGGYIDDNWYTDEGYGLPSFKDPDDSLKIAYEFVKNEKENLIIQAYKEPESEPPYEPTPSNIPSDKIYTKDDVTLVPEGNKREKGENKKIYSIKTKDGKFYTKYDFGGYSYWYDSANNVPIGDRAYDYVFAFSEGIESAVKKLNQLIK